jgi:hypothetical protein
VPIIGLLTAFDAMIGDAGRSGIILLTSVISLVFLVRFYPAYKRSLATMRAGNSERRAAQ